MAMFMIGAMRALIASTVGAAFAAALVVPMVPSHAGAVPTAVSAVPAVPAAPAQGNPASVQSLPLTPLPQDSADTRSGAADTPDTPDDPPGTLGLAPRDVDPYALLGIVWTDAGAELGGEAQVRTRSRATGEWSEWHHLHASAEHGPDAGSAEEVDAGIRGGTDPLWIGDADGVQARVLPSAEGEPAELPEGLHLELINPGDDPAAEPVAEPVPVEPAERAADEAGDGAESADAARLAASRPSIVSRSGWGADESWRESGHSYTDVVKTVFVHHTAGGNSYTCAQAASVIRGIYQYHTQSQGWRDIGYNFLVDKCGTIYEGRAGGVERAVMGAHTYGFNHNSMGVAVLGTYSSTAPSSDVNNALARLSSWKLGLDGRSPTGTWNRVSGGGKYAAGTVVRMHNISGHRDGFATECPGDRLYSQLPAIRTAAGRL